MRQANLPFAKFDCRHFVGEKPCRFSHAGCEDCAAYDPMGVRILIIKLAAMGDVIRTTPLVAALRERHEHCHVTWACGAATAPLLRGAKGIDKVIVLNGDSFNYLAAQSFNELYCLDKEMLAISLSSQTNAELKKGFTMTPQGAIGIHDDDAAYALRLGVDDPLKFIENQNSYQEIIFEACGLSFSGETIVLGINNEDRTQGQRHLESCGKGPWIGINTGAGDVFATKRLSEEKTAALAKKIADEIGMTPVLLGGKTERQRNDRILKLAGNTLLDAGTDHPIRDFVGIISALSALVCVDTLAMHLAVAQAVPVAAIFGPTCHQEVHLYGIGEKIISAPWCSPCYKGSCDHHTCMNEISVDEIIERLRSVLNKRGK